MTKLNRTKVLDAVYDDADNDLPERVIVTLKRGWAFDARGEQHVKAFDNHEEANIYLKRVERCNCDVCAKQTVISRPA